MDKLFASRKTMLLIVVMLCIAFILLMLSIFFKPAENNTTTIPKPPPAIKTAYTAGTLKKDFNRISSRKPLSVSDESIKEKLLTKIGNRTGVILKTSTYQIQYLSLANQFIVQINADDSDKAKKDSELWLTQQGLSQEGICNLPVVYFLGPLSIQVYKQSGKQFNPIPDGC